MMDGGVDILRICITWGVYEVDVGLGWALCKHFGVVGNNYPLF